VVIYAPNGMTRSAFALAERFKHAIEAKARERERVAKGDIIHYNVFVVTGALLRAISCPWVCLTIGHRPFL
jgi:hypothetical protein